MLFFGVVGGIGSGLISLPAKIAIGYYFETKRALAVGIAECGSGVGVLVFSPLATFLLNQYDWKITMLITSGLCLSCAIFGVLMRPLEEQKDDIVFDESHPELRAKLSKPAPWGSGQSKKTVTPFSKKDLFYGGSVQKLMKSNETTATWDEFRHLLLSTHDSTPKNQNDGKKSEEPEEDESIWKMMKEMISLELLKDPRFLLVAISTFFQMLGFLVPFVFLINMATTSKGFEKADASFLVSIIGIGNIIGKLATGGFCSWASDKSWFNSFTTKNVFICLSGVSIILFPLCTSYWMMIIVSSMYGFFTAFVILRTIVLVDLLGLDKLTSAFGLMALFEGTGALLGPVIGGAIYSATGGYEIPFFVAGGFLIFASLVGVCAQILQWRRNTTKK